MTNAQKLALKLSEIRQKLNELSGKDSLTDGEQNEMRTLSTEYPTVESRWRASVIAEGDDEAAAAGDDGDGDGENRERRELRGRCRVGPLHVRGAGRAAGPGRGGRAERRGRVSGSGSAGAVPGAVRTAG